MVPTTDSTRAWNGSMSRRVRLAAVLLLGCIAWMAAGAARADATLDASLLPGIQSATFEVVAAKPRDTLSYEKPLPMDLLPYQERTDKYYSVGTAFAIGPNRFVTAAHVLMIGYQSLWGPPELRDASGKVYAIDKVEKFALRRDFVVFSLVDPPKVAPLAIDATPSLNQVVFSVGNALGTGVVIRNGLYTSDTPEEQDGQWKWIRFSAAASPGNSCGSMLAALAAPAKPAATTSNSRASHAARPVECPDTPSCMMFPWVWLLVGMSKRAPTARVCSIVRSADAALERAIPAAHPAPLCSALPPFNPVRGGTPRPRPSRGRGNARPGARPGRPNDGARRCSRTRW